MAQKNKNLHAAKAAKNDEFYTQYNDIAEELKHYTKHFEGKTVFCNCDDPEWSKFWQYFVAKFESSFDEVVAEAKQKAAEHNKTIKNNKANNQER